MALVKSVLRRWKFFLKLALVVGLFYFLGKKGFISLEATRRAFTEVDVIIPAMIALFGTTAFAIIRWQWLLRAQNFNISWMQATQLTFIGNFFNIALPGAVSGDFVKTFYIAKEVGGQRARCFGAILFDRVAGLSGLVLLSAGALIAGIGSFKGTALFLGVKLFVGIAAVCVLTFYAYLFLVREHHDPVLWLFRTLEKKFPKVGSFTRIYEGLRYYHNHRWVVTKSLVISVLIHLVVSCSCVGFAYALGERDISALAVLVIVPLGLLVTAVPIMPGGIGTGHAAFGWLFHFLGTQRGADIFSLFVLTQFIGGGIGGLVYLRYRGRAPKLDVESAEPAVEEIT